MVLAALLSSFKTFWSLLVASALVWSGTGLGSISIGNNPSGTDAAGSGDLRGMVQSAVVKDDDTVLNKSDVSPVPSVVKSDMTHAYFDTDADYRILTRYGGLTEVALADFLAEGVSAETFSLASCDDARADYYRSVAVDAGKLMLESNALGHVHGTNTETETVCTVTATGEGGSHSQEFQLYTVSDRTPAALPPGALTVVQARTDEMDIQVDVPGSLLGHLRIGWRAAGSQPTFAVARDVGDDTVLTITGLRPNVSYEIRAYLMTSQGFDLYRASNTGPAASLIAEGSPDSKWISNLAGSGLGKSQSISQATLPTPAPDPLPAQTPETILPLTPRPTPEEDEEEDDDPIQDTPTPTDNDGTDSDGIDTPTPTDNDGTDTDNDGTTTATASTPRRPRTTTGPTATASTPRRPRTTTGLTATASTPRRPRTTTGPTATASTPRHPRTTTGPTATASTPRRPRTTTGLTATASTLPRPRTTTGPTATASTPRLRPPQLRPRRTRRLR